MPMIYPGYVLSVIRRCVNNSEHEAGDKITIEGHEANGMHGVHHAIATLEGDPTLYRVIVAPVSVPLAVIREPINIHQA